jgi:hypothetical protein
MPEQQLTEQYMVQYESRVLCLSLLCGARKHNKVYCAPHMTQSPAYAEMSASMVYGCQDANKHAQSPAYAELPACMVCGCQDANKHAQSPAYAELPAYMLHAHAHSSMQ